VKAYIVMPNPDGERDVCAKVLNLFEIKGNATKEIDLRETLFYLQVLDARSLLYLDVEISIEVTRPADAGSMTKSEHFV